MKRESLLVLLIIILVVFANLSFGQAPTLGTASSFALFTADGALTNSGASVVTGDIGTNVGAFSGFTSATVVGQTRLPGSTQAAQAAVDVVSAYNSLTSVACTTTILPELGGQILTPGVSCQNTADPTTLNGTLTLSGPGIFIIKLNSALTTATNSTILLTNGASANNVFFQVNGAATLGTGSTFRGTILAAGAIVLGTQASLEGRGLSTVGAITLNNNIVTNSALSLSAVAGPCDPATNLYSTSGIVSFTNAMAGTATLTDGPSTTTVSVNAGDTSVPYSLTGLTSATGSHTVTVSYASQIVSVTYVAPISCSVASALALVVAPGACNTVDNAYDLTGTISFTAAVASTLTISDGASTATVSVTAGQSSASFSLSALDSGTGVRNVTVTGLGYSPISTTYTAPSSCTAVAPASLGGLVFADSDNNGLQDGGDTPIAGVVVTLLDGTNSPVTSTTTTSSGLYSFTGLTPGVPYSVSFTTPTGYSATASNITGPVTLTAGENNTIVAKGFAVLTASLGGFVFVDTNRNGIQDADDTSLPDVEVTLLDATNTPVASTTTNVAGLYSFTGLSPAVPYSVSITAPVGYTATTPNVGGDDTKDSDLVGGLTPPLTLTSGENNTSLDGGFYLIAPGLDLLILVDKSVALPGETLTYSVILTNIGNSPATNVVVRDSTGGLTYLPGTVSAPAGTTYVQGTPVSLWTVATISAGQSLTLTYQALVASTGVIYNTATIPGVTQDRVCTSVPITLCQGDEYTLTVPEGRAGYQWYRDGVLIPNQTTNVLTIIQAGSYSSRLDNAGSSCPDFSCCPAIFEIDSLPVFQAVAIQATCLGAIPQANGRLTISGFKPTHTYQYSAGATFDPATSLSGAPQALPANGVLANNLASPASSQPYTIRVYNQSGCYVDQTVILLPTVCDCPTDGCVPYVLTQSKRPKRIGDPIR